MAARVTNFFLGVWLFISSFLWPMPQASRVNGIVVGLLCAASSAASIWKPVVKSANTVLGLWLFFTALAFGGTSSATVWNQNLVAMVIVILSLAPVESEVPLFKLKRDLFHVRRPGGPQPW